MLVTVNNIDYKVYWRYFDTGETTCTILQKDFEDTEFSSVGAIGVAKLSEKDQFNKNIGRKVSFTRALQQLYPGSGEEVRDPDTKKLLYRKRTEKEEKIRLLFWKEYFEMRHETHERKQLENSSN